MTDMKDTTDKLKVPTKKALVLHCGGLDSGVALFMAMEDYGGPQNVESIGIDYGQRHVKELEYAQRLCDIVGVKRRVLKLNPIENTMLTDASVEIPNVSYDDLPVGISPTYVPFRNGLMLANLASIAQAEGFNGIYFGAHAEDANNWAYPDCTPEFIGAMANAIYIGTYMQTRLHTPLQWLMKSEIVAVGAASKVPFDLTWSCYKGEEQQCGTCPTCISRRQAFTKAGVKDPTRYAA